MKFVLKLKHWQLFLISFGIPFLFYIFFFVSMFTTMTSRMRMGDVESMSDPVSMLSSMFVMWIPLLLAWFIAGATIVTWVYQVATGLYKKLPVGHTMKIKRFYFAFFYPIVYITTLVIVGLLAASMAASNPGTLSDPPASLIILFPIIFILHIVAIVSMFYTLYFMAKSLKSVELQRDPKLGEYGAEFVLMWFFMIGIWFIQPRINELFSGEQKPSIAA